MLQEMITGGKQELNQVAFLVRFPTQQMTEVVKIHLSFFI